MSFYNPRPDLQSKRTNKAQCVLYEANAANKCSDEAIFDIDGICAAHTKQIFNVAVKTEKTFTASCEQSNERKVLAFTDVSSDILFAFPYELKLVPAVAGQSLTDRLKASSFCLDYKNDRLIASNPMLEWMRQNTGDNNVTAFMRQQTMEHALMQICNNMSSSMFKLDTIRAENITIYTDLIPDSDLQREVGQAAIDIPLSIFPVLYRNILKYARFNFVTPPNVNPDIGEGTLERYNVIFNLQRQTFEIRKHKNEKIFIHNGKETTSTPVVIFGTKITTNFDGNDARAMPVRLFGPTAMSC
jgi:hypothetical protein